MDEIRQLEEAIAALEAQRPVLGDSVVQLALESMAQKLAALKAGQGESEHEVQQRKLVTVLFADLSGFTTLAEQMDAEDITDLMNALWSRLDRIITRHGGRIDKHIGDAIMAVWGVDTAQENDAEQAIRAALEMQAELAQLNLGNEIPGLRGLPDQQTIAMRIGINTGAALLGAVGTTGEFTAIGDAVNTASRLQNAAPLNGIIISHDTFRHVRGLFRVRPLEPLSLKGKTEPVAVYLVEMARPHAFKVATRGFEDLDTRMVGRTGELNQLQADFMEGLQERRPRMVTIIGEAGVGKSRLLYEFSSWLELQPHLSAAFKIRATQQTSSVPGLLIRQLIATHLDIRENDSVETITAKLAQGLSTVPASEVPLEDRALILGTWAGYDLPDHHGLVAIIGPRQLRDRGLIHLGEMLTAGAAEVPLVLLLEDLQWADDQSLDAIQFIQRACAHVPLLTICVARPGLLERRPDWPACCSTLLELRPLNETESRALVHEILQKARLVPEALCSLIVQRAEGNPFYTEELIKMLIEEQVIQTHADQWRIDASRLETLHIPATLTGVLQARLDSLVPDEKSTLQRASILGRIFWDRAVAHLSKEMGKENTPHPTETTLEKALQTALNGLRDRRLIYRRDKPAFEGTAEYIFVHVLLRDVAYESVLKRDRRHYHAEAARWLARTAKASGREDEFSVLIAGHFEQAGELLSAQEWYQRGAVNATLRYANAEARHCLDHALALTPTGDLEHCYDLIMAREKVINLLGDRAAQLEDLNALADIANRLAQPGRQAEVGLRYAHYA
ncbi:MAG TPA: adenylate/guanylate cyclase domain-containing protein, partial [Anaerolineaceae bacterium]|nr:adenylate/guanylate cyclase domain-containing protein [Anaerolineaceae bacterium]